MSDTATRQADLEALNELIVNCPDFEKLEALLGGFNLFQVLKFEYGEIRHSNVLAWILDPFESHGLDATFLKKWLMRVIHEASSGSTVGVSAVDIDTWQLADVEVRREWRSIDLLLILDFAGGDQWVLCIENKVASGQHSNQLRRYRTIVQETFPTASRHLFIFLTMREETAEDESYLHASYTQVHHVLKECMKSRAHAVGREPVVLMENYVRLLEEKFMDESEIARTALKIYQQHKRALDVIFAHRPDNIRMVNDKIRALLDEKTQELGIKLEPASKAFIRFIPCAWDQPGNTHGTAWSGTNRTVLFEINLSGKQPYLYATSGKAPDTWIDHIWHLSEKPPFARQKKDRPPMWCAFHIANKKSIALDFSDISDPSETARRVFDWCVKSYLERDTQDVVRIVADELPQLEEFFRSAPQSSVL